MLSLWSSHGDFPFSDRLTDLSALPEFLSLSSLTVMQIEKQQQLELSKVLKATNGAHMHQGATHTFSSLALLKWIS